MTTVPAASEKDGGIALLVVLWTLSLLALLSLSFAQNAWIERHRVRNLIDAAAAKAGLQAGLSFGAAVLLHAGNGQGWARDGTAHHMLFGQSDIIIALQDANGCLNINTAGPAEIDALLTTIGLDKNTAQSLAAAIIDWRDSDQLLTPNGAELPQYLDAGLQETPANRPFLATEELNGVLGMTPGIADQLLLLVSVFPTGPEINRSTAPAAVLRADRSIPSEEVTAILARRATRETNDPFGTADDTKTIDTQPRSATQADLANTAEGPVFSISVAVATPSGATARGRAEVWLTGDRDQPYRVLNWYLDRSVAATVVTP